MNRSAGVGEVSSSVITMAASSSTTNPNCNYWPWNTTPFINNTLSAKSSSPFSFSSSNSSSSTSFVSPSLLVPSSNDDHINQHNPQLTLFPFSINHLDDQQQQTPYYDHQGYYNIPGDSFSQLLMSGLMNNCRNNQENEPTINLLPQDEMIQYDHHTMKREASYQGNENYSSTSPDHIHGGHHQYSSNTTTTTTTSSSPQSSSCVSSGGANLVDLSSTPPPPPKLAEPPSTSTVQAATSLAVRTTSQFKKNSSLVDGGGAGCGGGGRTPKKAKGESASSSLSTFKVRKFGDKITNLHQLVSPFGKTDAASVLLETIGYIRFLLSQIEALSIPYSNSGNGSSNFNRQDHAHNVEGDRSCLFPEDPGQLLNGGDYIGLKRKAVHHQTLDLSSRGLCLVPVSSILGMGSENGADYWTPSLGYYP